MGKAKNHRTTRRFPFMQISQKKKSKQKQGGTPHPPQGYGNPEMKALNYRTTPKYLHMQNTG
jgi:hypothetical protein